MTVPWLCATTAAPAIQAEPTLMYHQTLSHKIAAYNIQNN